MLHSIIKCLSAACLHQVSVWGHMFPQVAQHPPGPAAVRHDGELSEHRQGQGALQSQICAAQQPAGLSGCSTRLDSRRSVSVPCSTITLSVKKRSPEWMCLCPGRGQGEDTALAAVVCHTPLSNLGHCRKGSTLSFSVAFQILRPGLYEVSLTVWSFPPLQRRTCDLFTSPVSVQLSQHMKLKLQFTASVSNPPPDARPLSRKNFCF